MLVVLFLYIVCIYIYICLYYRVLVGRVQPSASLVQIACPKNESKSNLATNLRRKWLQNLLPKKDSRLKILLHFCFSLHPRYPRHQLPLLLEMCLADFFPQKKSPRAWVKILVEALVAAIEPFMASHTPTMPKMMHEKTLLFLSGHRKEGHLNLKSSKKSKCFGKLQDLKKKNNFKNISKKNCGCFLPLYSQFKKLVRSRYWLPLFARPRRRLQPAVNPEVDANMVKFAYIAPKHSGKHPYIHPSDRFDSFQLSIMRSQIPNHQQPWWFHWKGRITHCHEVHHLLKWVVNNFGGFSHHLGNLFQPPKKRPSNIFPNPKKKHVPHKNCPIPVFFHVFLVSFTTTSEA